MVLLLISPLNLPLLLLWSVILSLYFSTSPLPSFTTFWEVPKETLTQAFISLEGKLWLKIVLDDVVPRWAAMAVQRARRGGSSEQGCTVFFHHPAKLPPKDPSLLTGAEAWPAGSSAKQCRQCVPHKGVLTSAFFPSYIIPTKTTLSPLQRRPRQRAWLASSDLIKHAQQKMKWGCSFAALKRVRFLSSHINQAW